jgi:hypothetical protein
VGACLDIKNQNNAKIVSGVVGIVLKSRIKIIWRPLLSHTHTHTHTHKHTHTHTLCVRECVSVFLSLSLHYFPLLLDLCGWLCGWVCGWVGA